MMCPICGAVVHIGPPEHSGTNYENSESVSLSRHMYRSHEEVLDGAGEFRRWARESPDARAPLNITNQEQLDAYCEGIGLLNHRATPPAPGGPAAPTPFVVALSGEFAYAEASNFDELLDAAIRECVNRARTDHVMALGAYFISYGWVGATREQNAAREAYCLAVAEFLKANQCPKIKRVMDNMKR